MSRSDWSRVRALFEEAWERDGPERAAFLDEACGPDAGLRAEVEELLRAEAGGAIPADPPSAGRVVLGLGAAELEGERVDGFLLRRVLARGGMGTVYEAEQESPRRRVALKVMNLELASDEARRRFRWEVEVLGRLRHPGIAQIFDAGVHTVAGRELPWFAMELVEDAQAVDRHASEQVLDLDERIVLFQLVCEAVHHGHQRGVIHRDLKPDNILVDATGRPKVIDFGVARATDSDVELTTLATRVGEVVGTLHYMSPEQVVGDRDALDVRSDVYALGVVLYQLLCGRLPYELDQKSLPEVARIVRDERPRPPSTFVPALRGDVETIVLKALEKDPERRYPSAQSLARDLQRFLRREPIEARPPSVGYQLALFARRNRVLTGSIAAVLVVSLVAAVVSLAFAFEASEQRSDAVAAEERERGQRLLVENLFQTLLDSSMASVEEHAGKLDGIEGTTRVRVDMVGDAVANLELLLSLDPENAVIRERIARAWLNQGKILGRSSVANVGDYAGAEAAFRRALETGRALLAENPEEPRLKDLVADALAELGEIVYEARDLPAAEELFREQVALLVEVAESQPTSAGRLGDLARGHVRLGSLLGSQGDHDAALGQFEQALAAQERVHRNDPEDPEVRHDLALSHAKMAVARLMLRDLEQALGGMERTVGILAALSAERPLNGDYRFSLAENRCLQSEVLLLLGQEQGSEERFAEAESILGAVLETLDDMEETDPENARIRVLRIKALWNVGHAHKDRAELPGASSADGAGHLDNALEYFRDGLERSERMAADGILPGYLRSSPQRFRELVDEIAAER